MGGGWVGRGREAPAAWQELSGLREAGPELGPRAPRSPAAVTGDRSPTPARRGRGPLSPRRAAGHLLLDQATRAPQTAPGHPAAPASSAPRTWPPPPPRRPRPGPPARGATRHLPEVGGRGAQRGEQQRQREGRGQPARQRGPIQHLAAPRRLTIALPAPRRAPRGRRPLIAPGAPGRGRGSQLGPARLAPGGVTPAPGAGRNPSQRARRAAARPRGPRGAPGPWGGETCEGR